MWSGEGEMKKEYNRFQIVNARAGFMHTFDLEEIVLMLNAVKSGALAPLHCSQELKDKVQTKLSEIVTGSWED